MAVVQLLGPQPHAPHPLLEMHSFALTRFSVFVNGTSAVT